MLGSVNSAAAHTNPSAPAQGVQQLEFVVGAAGQGQTKVTLFYGRAFLIATIIQKEIYLKPGFCVQGIIC